MLIFFISFPLAQEVLISNQEYIAGEDGIIRMNVNILGHVKNPGTYLVHDGIDLLTLLSQAGGYLDGSKLNEILIYSTDGTKKKINFNKHLHSKTSFHISIKPFDTIYIEQKIFSKIITSSKLPSLLLSLLNIAITLERTD